MHVCVCEGGGVGIHDIVTVEYVSSTATVMNIIPLIGIKSSIRYYIFPRTGIQIVLGCNSLWIANMCSIYTCS